MRSCWLQIGVQEAARPPAPYVFTSIEQNIEEEMGDRYKPAGQESDAQRGAQGLSTSF